MSLLHLASLLMVQHIDWFAQHTHLDATIDLTHAVHLHIKSAMRPTNWFKYDLFLPDNSFLGSQVYTANLIVANLHIW